ncbi:MAG: hypothetical protein ACLF0G_07730 [Candidatus Brocadiia bacterium]
MRPACIALLALLAASPAARAADSEGIEITRFLPKFRSDQTVERIQEGLEPAKELDSALRASTEKIWQLIEEYRKAPSTELENKIYNAVADSGQTIVEHVNRLEGQRDRLRDELRELNFNVDTLLGNIATYTTSLEGRTGDFVEEAKALKDELTRLARYLVDHPDDMEKRQAFRHKVIELKRLRYKLRLYERNKAMYAKLADQIGRVSRFFTRFESRLDAVLDALAVQKRFIAMNLAALRDKAKVVAWLRGEADGSSGVAAMMKQLSDLSSSIQSFEKVMDVMMNLGGDFDNFAEMMPELADPALAEDADLAEGELDTLIQRFANGQ